jgi:hypothetical protein
MVNSTNGQLRQRHMNSKRYATLTSSKRLLRGGAPSIQELLNALNTIHRGAAAAEIDDKYADRVAKELMRHENCLDLLRSSLVLVFKNTNADTILDAVENILAPALHGLCKGQHKTGNFIGTGMCGSDGREHLSDLERDEGEPLQRIIDAIARNCPQDLYGHPESDND